MVLRLIQGIIADMCGYEREKDVKLNFSFTDDLNMDEEDFLSLLEALETETDVDLVSYANRFETVKDLLEFIEDPQSIYT